MYIDTRINRTLVQSKPVDELYTIYKTVKKFEFFDGYSLKTKLYIKITRMKMNYSNLI